MGREVDRGHEVSVDGAMGSDDAQFALSETWMQMACLISRKASIMDGVKLEYHVWVSVPGLFPTVY